MIKPMPLATASRHSSLGLRSWIGLLLGFLMLALMAAPARAADDVDPPGRAGRLAEVRGQVWIYAPDSNEWIQALRNRPVTTGDRLSTEADGRAEVRIGSTVLHVAPNTEVEVVRLDDERVSLQLHAGSVAARLRTREAADEFSLRTDEGRFVTERPGQYRFDRADDLSAVTVNGGQARYESNGTALDVQAGQRTEFWKDRGVPQYSVTEPRRDDFASWVAADYAGDDRSISSRYVSPEMTGVEDLDRHGRWEAQTEYGPVWIPRTVVAGWAPYRMGHWAWVSPWGWTWVDDAPWGFAPFHYGRWVWYRNAWCWAPGRYVARPVYAPALVAWVGRPGVSVSVRVGSAPTVGWFPLGPREVYVPSYRVSPRYVQNVNVTHVTKITNVTTIINNPGQAMANTRYVNRRLPHAVTVVPANVVERRQPVGRAYAPVNERVLRDLERQRPRADAPVVAPPRFEGGPGRAVVDPRVSRPATPRSVNGPGGQPREGEGRDAVRPPAGNATPARPQDPRFTPAPGRGQESRDRDGRDPREARGGDVRDPREGRDRRDERDAPGARDGNRGREAPVSPAVPQRPRSAPPQVGQPGSGGNPPAVIRSTPPEARPPRDHDRTVPAPPREERRRPQQDIEAPQPRMVAPPPQMQAPAAPPQVVRPPVVQRPPQAAMPQPQPQPQAEPRGRGRVEERERPDRGERMERGERGERR